MRFTYFALHPNGLGKSWAPISNKLVLSGS